MALISNSSIRDWLQFNGAHVVIPDCQFVNYTGHLEYNSEGGDIIDSPPVITNVSCAHICHDSASIFSPKTSNLVTCGLWSTILTAYTTFGPGNALLPNQNDESAVLFNRFEEVGLNLGSIEYASAYADTISSCLQLLYYNAKILHVLR